MEALVLSLGLSLHAGLAGDYNSVHPHVRYQDGGAIAGAYYNSVDRVSFYAGHRLEYGDAGVEFALVTGYPAFGPVAPFVRGTYDLGKTRMFVSPAFENYDDSNTNVGVVLGVEFSLK